MSALANAQRLIASAARNLAVAYRAQNQAHAAGDERLMCEADDNLDDARAEFRAAFKAATGVDWSEIETGALA